MFLGDLSKFAGLLKKVSTMSQGSFRCVLRVYQDYFKKFMRVFQGCFEGFSRQFQMILNIFQEGSVRISSKFPGHFMEISRVLHKAF